MTGKRFCDSSMLVLAAIVFATAVAPSLVAYPFSEGRRGLVLSDGTQVQLILDAEGTDPSAILSRNGGRKYYYLPPSSTIRLSKRENGTPEFLLVKFTTEKKESEGGVSGAIMHFLMEYGLTPGQETEIRNELKKTRDELLGPLPLKPDGDASTFVITSATLKDETMTKSLVTSGKAPLLPGQKVAAAARLTANGAQLLAATLERARSIADCSVSFNLSYTVVTPAVKGTAVYHARKIEAEKEKIKKDYEHSHETTGRALGFLWETSGEDSYSYSEVRSAWKYMVDQKLVEINFVETVNDERASKIRDAVFQMFMQSFFSADKPTPEQMAQATAAPAKPDDGPGVQGDHYHSSIYRSRRQESREDRVWNFSYGLPMTESYTMTGNLASWYQQVRDNPSCVISVNLNDPFFTHRDINFILDLDAKEIFDDVVNYVTINVRKTRSSGNAFEDHRTIDAAYLKNKGVAATVTYARGDDTNPDVYEYQAQWSLKGGNIFPASPPWQSGNWEGVTLAPPVQLLTIEMEGDLDAIKAKEITRVTAEVHYSQFGKERSDVIHLSAVGSQPVVTKKLFRDRDMNKYAYRLIYNHKTAGKLVGPWIKDQNDGYVPVVLPEDMLTAESFKERAKGLATGAVERVLERLGGQIGSR